MKVGLIGAGYVAGWHMQVYKYLRNVKVTAICDIVPEKAKILAHKYKVDTIFSNYVDLLESKDLDFVDICTPPSTHAPIVCDAARFGHNILLEKPMARSTVECEKMISESKRHGVKLCVCHNQIFLSSIRQAKSLVDSAYYPILSFKSSLHLYKPVKHAPWALTHSEGGFLWELAYHPAYILLYFLPNINEVYAIGGKLSYQVYDNFAVILRTRGLSYGLMDFSFTSKERERTCTIVGSNGNKAQIDLEYDCLIDKSKVKHWGIRGLFNDEKRLLGKSIKYALRSVQHRHLGIYFLSHFRLIKTYIESLQNDSPPPVQPEEGKKTVKLLECIEESLNRHQAVLMYPEHQ